MQGIGTKQISLTMLIAKMFNKKAFKLMARLPAKLL